MLDYVIEVSTDKETWTEVAKGDTVDGTTEIKFEPVAARYVKLTATKSYQYWK
ncbi:MAG: discoidin domain-containing protein [Lachnospiraceae bacterium]|nr:discoidin domain-containing protein [Lachnospiraceae bacterium]